MTHPQLALDTHAVCNILLMGGFRACGATRSGLRRLWESYCQYHFLTKHQSREEFTLPIQAGVIFPTFNLNVLKNH